MSTKEISFLILSDIHLNKEKINKLIEKIKQSNIIYDYLLCCGDIVSIPDGKQNIEEYIKKNDPIAKELLMLFKQIPINKKYLFIPGNHESKTLFENKEEFIEGVNNLHNKYMKLEENLYIVGLGGGVPVLFGEPQINKVLPYTDINTKNVLYIGYPYNYSNDIDNYNKSDDDYGKELNNLIDELKKKEGDNNIILFTHAGPFSIWTNYEVSKERNAYFGSKNLEKTFLNENNIFLNIHGHTHRGKGLVQLPNNKYVVNPGDFRNGNYATLKINQKENGKWYVKESYFGIVQ